MCAYTSRNGGISRSKPPLASAVSAVCMRWRFGMRKGVSATHSLVVRLGVRSYRVRSTGQVQETTGSVGFTVRVVIALLPLRWAVESTDPQAAAHAIDESGSSHARVARPGHVPRDGCRATWFGDCDVQQTAQSDAGPNQSGRGLSDRGGERYAWRTAAGRPAT